LHTDPKTAVTGHRRRLTLLAVVGLIATAVLLSGCSDGDDADALPAYTGAPSTTADTSPSQSPEAAAEAAALAYYATLRELFMNASADRERLSQVASGPALKAALKELRGYQDQNMPDNGKRTVEVLEVTPKGENVYVRTCYDKRKVRFKEPDGDWGTTLVVNIDEQGLTMEPTATGWTVASVKNIFSGGCHR
jgi:hypothetical protein